MVLCVGLSLLGDPTWDLLVAIRWQLELQLSDRSLIWLAGDADYKLDDPLKLCGRQNSGLIIFLSERFLKFLQLHSNIENSKITIIHLKNLDN